MKLRVKNKVIVFITGVIAIFILSVIGNYTVNVKGNEKNGSNTSMSQIEDKNKDGLTKLIERSFNKNIIYNATDYFEISEETLKLVYNRGITLEAWTPDYSVIIEGKNITDYTKEVDTQVEFQKRDEGYLISKIKDDKLPGKVVLKINSRQYRGKYLYIYNVAHNKYMMLSDDNVDTIVLGKGEKYLITNTRLYKMEINYKLLIGVVGVLLLMIIIYIITKKKYWFW